MEPDAAPPPHLPTVLSVPTAPWPPGALAEGHEATVLLELDLDEAGRVTGARVAESGGEAFDGAALSVAHELRFTPARDAAGLAVPARIQFAYRFEQEAMPVLAVRGLVRAGGSREALPRASVVAEPMTAPGAGEAAAGEAAAGEAAAGEAAAGEAAAGEAAAGEAAAGEAAAGEAAAGEAAAASAALVTEITDEEGRFDLAGLAPGPWRILVAAPGYEGEQVEVEVVAGQVVEVDLWLAPDRPWQATAEAGEVIEIVGHRLAPEISERRLEASEVRTMPGTGGDIVRAVQAQPGVARSPFSTGSLVVRGTSADATGFFLGGVPVPIVYHFGGLSTVVNSDVLSEVLFLPGSYGVRYGRRLGGVVDLVTDDALPERSGGYLRIDLLQASLFHEQRLGERWSVTASARRSYIDALLAPVVNLDPTYNLRLPAFTDGQLRLLHRRRDGSVVEAMLLGSDDRFTYTEYDAEDGDSAESRVTISFAKLWLRWEEILAGGWRSEVVVMSGPEQTRAEYQSSEEAYERAQRDGLRLELTRPVPEGRVIGWRFGLDLESVQQEFAYQVDDLDGFFPYASDEAGEGRMLLPGVYLEQTQRAGPVDAMPGVRVDHLATDFGYSATAVDPRLRVRAEAGPATVLHAGVGRYSQFPLMRELLDVGDGGAEDGALDELLGLEPETTGAGLGLVPEWSIQASLGVEHQLRPELSIEATLYHAWLGDLVVGRDNRFSFDLAPPPMAPYDTDPYANDGTGRSLGLETLTRWEDERTLAFLALTLARATRVERPGQERALFEYDQPLLLTLVGSRQLRRGWRVGGRLRLTSGNPYTPVVNRTYDLDEHVWYPVFDATTTARMPAWWALDLRGDKEWTFRRWALSLYLDLQNATNRRNVELLNFTPDYSAEIPVYGLPILPAFGLEAKW